MGIIFDLDQTLIDSNIALDYRRNRDWKKVYSLIPNFKVFDGINNLINMLRKNNIPICVVTSSPRSYCEKVLSYFGWDDFKMVCYHDTVLKKPYKDPIEKGIMLLNESKKSILSIGDDIKDIDASNSAGVISIAVTWGINYNKDFKNADYIFNSVEDLKKFICSIYNIL